VKAILKADKIRELALRRGLRLHELAETVGLTPVSFSNALAGRHELRPRTRARLMQALGLSFDEAFELVDGRKAAS
jgi:transcriptional regulator with XRE-family HTH domain